jgi:UDP-N-acetylglucosamine:LPS N-acetylglucosamine transferase
VRQDLIDVESRVAAMDYLDRYQKTLVLGGSLGARRVNQLIERTKHSKPECSIIIWQW